MAQRRVTFGVVVVLSGATVFCWIAFLPSPSKINKGLDFIDAEPSWMEVQHQVILDQGLKSGHPKVIEPQRTDVLTVTQWLAPIVWEGTFDPVLIDRAFKAQNLTIAVTVFAVARYVRFLRDFLESAEQHFMVGMNVHYYVFTNEPAAVPRVNLTAGRLLSVIKVPKFDRWQEISLRRMELIQTAIEETIHQKTHYIYCLDVDMKFHHRVGPEILSQLVAAIHPWWFWYPRDQLPYERRPVSTAFISPGEGDFYYQANVFGGALRDVHRLVRSCRKNLEQDKAVGVEAAWQEESHLNWYMARNKPTKLLSPEYTWDDKRGAGDGWTRLVRFSHVLKDLKEVRENR